MRFELYVAARYLKSQAAAGRGGRGHGHLGSRGGCRGGRADHRAGHHQWHAARPAGTPAGRVGPRRPDARRVRRDQRLASAARPAAPGSACRCCRAGNLRPGAGFARATRGIRTHQGHHPRRGAHGQQPARFRYRGVGERPGSRGANPGDRDHARCFRARTWHALSALVLGKDLAETDRRAGGRQRAGHQPPGRADAARPRAQIPALPRGRDLPLRLLSVRRGHGLHAARRRAAALQRARPALGDQLQGGRSGSRSADRPRHRARGRARAS